MNFFSNIISGVTNFFTPQAPSAPPVSSFSNPVVTESVARVRDFVAPMLDSFRQAKTRVETDNFFAARNGPSPATRAADRYFTYGTPEQAALRGITGGAPLPGPRIRGEVGDAFLSLFPSGPSQENQADYRYFAGEDIDPGWHDSILGLGVDKKHGNSGLPRSLSDEPLATRVAAGAASVAPADWRTRGYVEVTAPSEPESSRVTHILNHEFGHQDLLAAGGAHGGTPDIFPSIIASTAERVALNRAGDVLSEKTLKTIPGVNRELSFEAYQGLPGELGAEAIAAKNSAGSGYRPGVSDYDWIRWTAKQQGILDPSGRLSETITPFFSYKDGGYPWRASQLPPYFGWWQETLGNSDTAQNQIARQDPGSYRVPAMFWRNPAYLAEHYQLGAGRSW